MSQLSLLGVFAHPDDEQIMSGTLAQAAAEGIKTGLVCATRGELGEISDPALATPDNLGKVREAEMRAACAVLGVKYLWFLDYRDSGMIGTEGNDDPRSFYRADEAQAVGRLVRIIRDFRPSVLVTFEEGGGYGHPDHTTMHRLATDAYYAAANPDLYPEAGAPWQTSRLYYCSFPRSALQGIGEWLKDTGIATMFERLDSSKLGLADEMITNVVDVTEWLAVKERSLGMHRTQMNPNSPFSKLPQERVRQFRSREHYALAAGVPLPEGEEARGDLFAGLRANGSE